MSRPAAPGRCLRAAALACAALLCCAGARGLAAAEATQGATRFATPESAAQRTPRLRAFVREQLDAAQRAVEAGDPGAALELLAALEVGRSGGRRLNSYERANLLYFRGFIEDARGAAEPAIAAYRGVLAEPGLPAGMELGTRWSLARLQLAREDWAGATDTLEGWFARSAAPTPEAHVLLAQAYHGIGEHAAALRQADAALAEAARRHLPPQENWYVLMRAAAYAAGDLPRTVDILLLLAREWPRKEYLLQLAAVYGEQGEAARRIAAMEAVRIGGWPMTEDELLGLAYLYLDAGLPVRAARLLEHEIAGGRVRDGAQQLALLGTAWQQAQETARALPVLERAARAGQSPETWLQLAGLMLEADRPAEAAAAAREALALGGGPRPARARVLLGTALWQAGELEAARETFLAAREDRRSRRRAAEWLRFLEAESARREQL